MPGLSAYGTGKGSRNRGHLCPQGRVFAGLVRGGGCRPLGPSRWHSWNHPALGRRAADALLSPSLKLTFGFKRSLKQRAAAFAVKATPARQLQLRDLWPLSCHAARARLVAGHRAQLLPAPGACAGLGATAAQPHAHGSIAAAPTPRGAALGVTGPTRFTWRWRRKARCPRQPARGVLGWSQVLSPRRLDPARWSCRVAQQPRGPRPVDSG